MFTLFSGNKHGLKRRKESKISFNSRGKIFFHRFSENLLKDGKIRNFNLHNEWDECEWMKIYIRISWMGSDLTSPLTTTPSIRVFGGKSLPYRAVEWRMEEGRWRKSAPLSSILHKFPSQITFNQLLMSESRNDNNGRTRSESSDDTYQIKDSVVNHRYA